MNSFYWYCLTGFILTIFIIFIWRYSIEGYTNINDHSLCSVPGQIKFPLPFDITVTGTLSNNSTIIQIIQNALSITPSYQTSGGVQMTGLTLTTTTGSATVNPMTTFNLVKQPSKITWRTILSAPSNVTYTGKNISSQPVASMYQNVVAYTTSVSVNSANNSIVTIIFEIFDVIESTQTVNDILADTLIITSASTGNQNNSA